MRILRNRDIVPPDGFRYTNSDTGWHNVAFDFSTWIDREKKHRSANGLTIPDNLELVMQDQLCATIGPEHCEYVNEGTWVNTRFTLDNVVTATKALFDIATGNLVDQEEAERRAEICSRCYLNIMITGCGACGAIANLVAPNRTTKVDQRLNNCAVCTCYNRLQVHVKLDTLSAHGKPEYQAKYPSFCWQKVGGENYRNGS